ncbi:hypothetical protein EOL70_06510 [Leucothrix sargassi]|nr:hypothetical protein EOL70_06510 [Leucothrix sargassi]
MKEKLTLSRSEKSYLFRRNFLRLLDIAVTAFWFFLLMGLMMGVTAGILLSDADLGIAMNAFLCLLLVIGGLFFLNAWGKPFLELLKMKWWVSEKDVEVISLSGHLSERIHSTQHLDNFMSIDNALVDFPLQWLSSVNAASNPVTFRVAKVANASNQIIRFPMSHQSSTRIDMVIGDFKYIALQTENASIDNDYSNKIPVNRNHASLFKIGLEAIILGGILTLLCTVLSDQRQQKINSAEDKMISAYAHLRIDNEVDESALANRDLPRMSVEPGYDKRVLSGEALKYVAVSRNDAKKVPFILSLNEFALIDSVSKLSPNVSVGYHNEVKPEYITAFRERLIKQANSLSRVPEPLKARFTERLQNMDDDLIARQLRSYGNGFVSDLSFVNALLPTPEIYPIAIKPQQPFCIGRVTLCPTISTRIKLETLDDFILTSSDNRYFLSDFHRLNYVEEVTTNFEKLRAAKSSFWLLMMASLVLGGGVLLQVLYWLARFKTKRAYAV